MKLDISLLDINSVEPNPWNPNVQNERQFQAEVESILTNGFLAPILARQIGEKYQVIDGEHRLRALKQIFVTNAIGAKNVPDLAKEKKIPAVLIEADDAHAKRLTIIMNETRGRADLAKLGELLNEIAPPLGEDLIIGLPYTATQLEELMDIAKFDWDSLTIPVNDDELNNQDEEEGQFKIAAVLSPDIAEMWKDTLKTYQAELPKDPKRAAGILIGKLLEKSQS